MQVEYRKIFLKDLKKLKKQPIPLLSLSENQTIIKKVVVGCEVERVMDVELQILKHLKRDARPTVSIIDQYCSAYNDLFSEVRSYECFKYLHQGIISPIKRKSLPEIANSRVP